MAVEHACNPIDVQEFPGHARLGAESFSEAAALWRQEFSTRFKAKANADGHIPHMFGG